MHAKYKKLMGAILGGGSPFALAQSMNILALHFREWFRIDVNYNRGVLVFFFLLFFLNLLITLNPPSIFVNYKHAICYFLKSQT